MVIIGGLLVIGFFAYLIPNMLVPGIFNIKPSSTSKNDFGKEISNNIASLPAVKNNQNTTNKNIKTFSGDGFSFQYDGRAITEKGKEDFLPDVIFYRVYEEGSRREDEWKKEYISFQTSGEKKCQEDVKPHQGITIDKKIFIYCEYPKTIDSLSYLTKIYFYEINRGTDLQIVLNVNSEKPNSYIIPESVKIK